MYISMMRMGLANQAFQYIFSRYLEETTQTRVYIDDSYFSLHGKTVHNGYELDYVFPNLRKPFFSSELFDADVWRVMIEKKRPAQRGIQLSKFLKAAGKNKSLSLVMLIKPNQIILTPIYQNCGVIFIFPGTGSATAGLTRTENSF